MSNAQKVLWQSIEHWYRIWNKEIPDKGTNTEPLCKNFYNVRNSTCFGCPVFNANVAHGCQDFIPYILWQDYVESFSDNNKVKHKVVGRVEDAKSQQLAEGVYKALIDISFLFSDDKD